jgi:hypothetical protein
LLQLADDDDADAMLKVVKRARGWRQCASRSILQPNPLVGAEIERRDGGKEEEDHGMMLERKKSEGDEARTWKYWLLPFAVYIKQYYSLWWAKLLVPEEPSEAARSGDNSPDCACFIVT